MISQRGMIEEISKQKAVVRVEKSSACAHCSSRDSCEVSNRDMLVEVANDLEAAVGDFVEISVPDGALLKLSLMIYLLPVIALVTGAFLGGFLAKALGINPSIGAIISGGIFLGAVFCVLKIYENSGKKYFPRMTRILPNEASPRACDSK